MKKKRIENREKEQEKGREEKEEMKRSEGGWRLWEAL